MRYTPFTNGTAAMFWQEQNCNKCRRANCASRLQLEKCSDFTTRNVEICGGQTSMHANGFFVELPARCKSFTLVPLRKKRSVIGRDTPELF